LTKINSQITDVNKNIKLAMKTNLELIDLLKNSEYDKIFDYYKNQQNLEELREDDDEIKITTGYILYEIIQHMLEKMFRVTRINTKDMRILEQKVFESDDYSLVREIMMKKRNIILIKNMFKPQVMLFKQLEYVINKMYE